MKTLKYLTPENAKRLADLAEARGKKIDELLNEIFGNFINKPNHLGISIIQLLDDKQKVLNKIEKAQAEKLQYAQEAAMNKSSYEETVKLWETVHNESLLSQKNIAESKEAIDKFFESDEEKAEDY